MGEQASDALMDAAMLVSPGLAAGVRSLREVLDTDGALPASHKALFTAVGAATQHQGGLCRSRLAKSREWGLEAVDAVAAASAVLLSRGEVAFRDYVAAIREVFEAEAFAGAVPSIGPGTSLDEALAYFTDDNGDIPARQRLFAELAPKAFLAYHLMHRAGLKDSPMGAQSMELMTCTVVAADLQPTYLEIHIRGARAAGATREAIVEAILAAVPVSGWAVWARAADALINAESAATE